MAPPGFGIRIFLANNMVAWQTKLGPFYEIPTKLHDKIRRFLANIFIDQQQWELFVPNKNERGSRAHLYTNDIHNIQNNASTKRNQELNKSNINPIPFPVVA